MFFDALWIAAYELIKKDCPALLVYLSSFMSLPLWISSLPVPARSPCGDVQAHSSDISPDIVPLLRIPLFNSGAPNSTERAEVCPEADAERTGIAGLRPRPLFATMDDSPPSSPSDTASEEDLDSPVPLHHPRPKHPSQIIVKPASSLIDGHYISPSTTPERASPSDPERELSRPPSLVPTIIVSRSPSPRPHPCISEAQAFGIKVRDFAFEDHAVPLAPAVPDIDQLKARYLLYRTAELMPPPEVVRKLNELDQEWIEENARLFDNQTDATNSRPKSSRAAWRRETKRWLGITEDEPTSRSEESGEVGEMTAKLKGD